MHQKFQVGIHVREPFWDLALPEDLPPAAIALLAKATDIARSVRDLPCPDTITWTYKVRHLHPKSAASELAENIKDSVSRGVRAEGWLHYRSRPKVREDVHHHLEDAARIVAAAESGHDVYLRVKTLEHDPRPVGDAPFWDDNRTTVWLGPAPTPQSLPRHEQTATIRRYWQLHAFREHSGRAIVHFSSVGEVALGLRAMARLGHSRAFLKAAKFKFGCWPIDLSFARNQEGAFEAMVDAMGALAIRQPDEGREKGWLLQEFVPMVNETRCFVVDGRVVGAVPVRRQDTVLDAVRGPGSIIEPRQCLKPDGYESCRDRIGVARRVRLARRVTYALSQENPEVRDYIVDVADREDNGEPIVIELNPLPNAGLYSMDPGIILKALLISATARENADSERAPDQETVDKRAIQNFVKGLRAEPVSERSMTFGVEGWASASGQR
jgi:hypothetical protein